MKKRELSHCEEIVSGLHHPEAIAWHSDGTLWAGGEGGEIYQINPQKRTWIQRASLNAFCLGLVFLDEVNLLVCDCKNHRLLLWDSHNDTVRDFATEIEGEKIHHPNYAVLTETGEILVSDSGHWGKNDGRLFRINSKGKGVVVDRGLAFLNGLAWCKESQILYGALSGTDEIIAWQRDAEAQFHRGDFMVSGIHHVIDGLVLGERQMLYACCYGNSAIYSISLESKKVERIIEDPQGLVLNRTTNLLFEKNSTSGNFLWMTHFGGYHISRLALSAP